MAWTLADNFKDRFNRIGHKGKTGVLHPAWKGGKQIDKDGYIRTWALVHPWPRKGYIHEHVRIMELGLGRRIKPIECVHHKNGIRQDNRLENLELLDRSTHSKLHRKKDFYRIKRGNLGRFVCGRS